MTYIKFLSVLSFYIFCLPFIQHTNISFGAALIQESKSLHIAHYCKLKVVGFRPSKQFEEVTYDS